MIICSPGFRPKEMAESRRRFEVHSGRDPVPNPPDLPPLPPIEPDPLDLPQPGPFRKS